MCNVERSRSSSSRTTGGPRNLGTVESTDHPPPKFWNETAMWGED